MRAARRDLPALTRLWQACFKFFSVSYHLVRLCYFCQIDISPYTATTERYLQKAHRPH